MKWPRIEHIIFLHQISFDEQAYNFDENLILFDKRKKMAAVKSAAIPLVELIPLNDQSNIWNSVLLFS